MRSNLARLVAVVLAVGGLLASSVPPASATTVKTFAFVGVLQLDGPLGAPCADGTVPPNLSKCPQPALTFTKPLPLPGIFVDIGGSEPFPQGGNTRGFAMASMACLSTGSSINEPGKSPVPGAGACATSATGAITGWCELATGLGTQEWTDEWGQTWFMRFHLKKRGKKLVQKGHWVKLSTGQTGTFVAVAAIQAMPTVGVPPGNSCLGKTATTFTLAGTGTLVG